MNDVCLRNVDLIDKEIIFKWILNPDLRKMIGTGGEPTKQEHNIWFERKINDKGNEFLIIEYGGKAVGIIGTNKIDCANKNAEMYLYIGETEEQGKGIAYSAVKLFIKMLNFKYHFHKIYARIFSYNLASIKLFEKCNFKIEGRFIDYIYLPEKKEYCDLLWYGYICKEEMCDE